MLNNSKDRHSIRRDRHSIRMDQQHSSHKDQRFRNMNQMLFDPYRRYFLIFYHHSYNHLLLFRKIVRHSPKYPMHRLLDDGQAGLKTVNKSAIFFKRSKLL